MVWGAIAGAGAGFALDKLFGDDGGQHTVSQGPPGWMRPYTENYLEDVGTTIDNRMGMPAYPEFPTVAPFTQPQLAGQEGALGYAGMLPGVTGQALGANLQGLQSYQNPFLGGYGSAFPQTVGTLQNYMGGGGPFQESRQGLSDLISEGPAMDVYGPISRQIYDEGAEYFAEQLAPSIRQDALNAGQFGSSRQNLATQKALDALGESVMQSQERLGADIYGQTLGNRRFGIGMAEDITGRERSQALQAAGQLQSGLGSMYGQASGDYYRALGMLPQTIGMGMTPYDIAMGVGGQQQQQNQRQIADQMGRFYANRDWELENLQQRGQLLQPMMSLYSQRTQPIYGSTGLQSAGLGMMLGSMFDQPESPYVPGDAYMPAYGGYQ